MTRCVLRVCLGKTLESWSRELVAMRCEILTKYRNISTKFETKQYLVRRHSHGDCKKLVSMSCLGFKFQGMYLPSEILPELRGASALFILKNLRHCVTTLRRCYIDSVTT